MTEKVWVKNYDEGVEASLEYPKITLVELFQETARKYPDKPCTIFKGAKISYQEMDKLTNRLAVALIKLGVEKGDRVGIFMPNTPQYVIAYLAILKAGGIVVATNFLYSKKEVEHQVNDAGIKYMFVMTNFYNTLLEVKANTSIKNLIVTNLKETLPPILRFLFTLTKEKKDGFRVSLAEDDIWMKDLIDQTPEDAEPNVEIDHNDVAIFQYTGGTTGISKGAIGLHRNLVANSYQLSGYIPGLEYGDEVVLMAIPLFHVYGMVAGMWFAFRVGASLVMIPNPRDIKDVLSSIEKYQASFYPGVPSLYNLINLDSDAISGKYDLSSIKACISGSAPLMRETKEKFEEITGGKLCEGYGLSETPTATHCNPIYGENRTGSIGLPMPDVDCKIISLDDEVTELEVGGIGELIVKGPQVFKGYHNMPTETTNALREGWLYTGDIARMDEDGYFYIIDRKKELIKPGGFSVWPREVEEVISDHPKVLEAGVAGIPDAFRGETVKAWVVLYEGESMTEEELIEWCRKDLASFKVPTEVEFLDELPKTTVGKILRRELVRVHKEKME